jgi:hypothetical protein
MVHLADLMLTNDLAWLTNIAKLQIVKILHQRRIIPLKN